MLMESSKSSEIDPFDRLYTAKWNVPKAAQHLGITNDECKALFSEFCRKKWASDVPNAD
jgi:hypothetical protein